MGQYHAQPSSKQETTQFVHGENACERQGIPTPPI